MALWEVTSWLPVSPVPMEAKSAPPVQVASQPRARAEHSWPHPGQAHSDTAMVALNSSLEVFEDADENFYEHGPAGSNKAKSTSRLAGSARAPLALLQHNLKIETMGPSQPHNNTDTTSSVCVPGRVTGEFSEQPGLTRAHPSGSQLQPQHQVATSHLCHIPSSEQSPTLRGLNLEGLHVPTSNVRGLYAKPTAK